MVSSWTCSVTTTSTLYVLPRSGQFGVLQAACPGTSSFIMRSHTGQITIANVFTPVLTPGTAAVDNLEIALWVVQHAQGCPEVTPQAPVCAPRILEQHGGRAVNGAQRWRRTYVVAAGLHLVAPNRLLPRLRQIHAAAGYLVGLEAGVHRKAHLHGPRHRVA